MGFDIRLMAKREVEELDLIGLSEAYPDMLRDTSKARVLVEVEVASWHNADYLFTWLDEHGLIDEGTVVEDLDEHALENLRRDCLAVLKDREKPAKAVELMPSNWYEYTEAYLGEVKRIAEAADICLANSSWTFYFSIR
jgi:hypothetical protein